jgi:group I intron endonuclease
MMIVYKFTNKINGKIYVGQTIQALEKRVKNHIKESKKNNNRPILNAIKKHGIENFDIEIIDTALTHEELDIKEIKWIKELNCLTPNGYNVLGGGQFKIKTTEEFGKRISEGLKNSEKWNTIKNSEEYKNKMLVYFSGSNKGKKFNEEHRLKIWNANKDRILEFNESTSKKWIIVEKNNNILRLTGIEKYCKEKKIDRGNMSRLSKKLNLGKIANRYYGIYCFSDCGQTDKEILDIVENLDSHFHFETIFYNKKSNKTIILKRSEFNDFCKCNNLDYSNFLKLIKGIFKSHKGWIVTKPCTTKNEQRYEDPDYHSASVL